MSKTLTTIIDDLESLLGVIFEKKLEIFRDMSKDMWMLKHIEPKDYRTPGERAIDSAWERNRV